MRNYYSDYFHAEERNGSLLCMSQIMPAQNTDRMVQNTCKSQICNNSSRGMGGAKDMGFGLGEWTQKI